MGTNLRGGRSDRREPRSSQSSLPSLRSFATIASRYLSYYFKSSNSKGHGTHSPFIFHFITKILNDKKPYPAYERVEGLRQQLLQNDTVLKVEDFGAGSTIDKNNERKISSIAKYAAKPKKYGQLLFRMVQAYQPATIIELGTSLGITTSYLSLAKPDARLITLEGSKEIANTAQQNFNTLGLPNIEIKEGNFDETLPSLISHLPSVDFAFIDGNHRYEPTVRYFEWLLPKAHNDSMIIFDDIHWSTEMEQAWRYIRQNPAVRCSVDLFFIGIVFFRREFHEKQHFAIRF